jgi:cytochrome c biogenesis protein CcmG, thiol:disulfide interchange protein DsbE
MSRYYLFGLPLVVLVVISFLLMTRLSSDVSVLPAARLGQPLPAFSLSGLSSDAPLRTGANMPRQVYLLNVWASWCAACVEEHAFLTELARKDITIIGLNYKDAPESALSFLQQHGNPFLFSLSDAQGDLAFDLGVYGAPETFVVDAEGYIRYRHVGILNAEAWLRHIRPYFAETASARSRAAW